MKTAIYVEDGVLQVVITPETDFERDAIKTVSDGAMETTIYNGEFYKCQGGWNRHDSHADDKKSLMIRAVKKEAKEPQ